ncbi:heterokaryon incompatibility protein-domain-containing protein [Xylaria acuta]|nr:heterokaryon incompatibility protein-domain-containing protein [Xylaria acuta]
MGFIRDRLLGKKYENNRDNPLPLPVKHPPVPTPSIVLNTRRYTDILTIYFGTMKPFEVIHNHTVQLTASSLSLRARTLSRRISSIQRSSNPPCGFCRNLDFQQIRQALSTPLHPDGLFLGWLSDNILENNCPLCRILAQVCIETCQATHSSEELRNPRPESRLQLRAFRIAPYLPGQQDHRYSSKAGLLNSDFFVAAVPGHFSLIPGSPDEAMIENMLSKRGYLVYQDGEVSKEKKLIPRLVSTNFEPNVVLNWLNVCLSDHDACRPRRSRCQANEYLESSLNLIDCRDRRIISALDITADSRPLYVALSYVWGDRTDVSIASDRGSLPAKLSPVVEDSIQVALILGYRYLWVDKYCVDNRNKTTKRMQLMHMDSVYTNAELTIVAAAGPDESYGLPGLSRKRSFRQFSFESDSFTLTSTLPLPHRSIVSSHWSTRGWTYQEAILSRRRLVFTNDQLYFECSSMNCCESLDIAFDKETLGPGSGPQKLIQKLIQPSLFGFSVLRLSAPTCKARRLSNLFSYVYCAEQYSQRTLTFDDDSLTAFSGIIRMLESNNTTFPVRHIWGVPFFHPDDDDLSHDISRSTYQSFQVAPFWRTLSPGKIRSSQQAPPDAEGVDYLAFLMLGLGWRHDHRSKPPRRRKNFPSWSWTGWEGCVFWPPLYEDSDIKILPSIETGISFGESSSEDVPTVYHKATDAQLLVENNKSLYIRTLAVSQTAIVLDGSSSTLLTSTGSRVRLYPSKTNLDASKVFKRIQNSRYEVIILAVIDGDMYMMLVKRYRNSYYRIGTLAVNAPALPVTLLSSRVKTYKLR